MYRDGSATSFLFFSFSVVVVLHHLPATHPARHNITTPHAPGLLPHPSVSTTLRRWDAGAKGRPTDNRKDQGREAFSAANRAGWVAGQPREARLRTCPIACNTPLDGVLDTQLEGALDTWLYGFGRFKQVKRSRNGGPYRIRPTATRADEDRVGVYATSGDVRSTASAPMRA
jgi:hypothetical protein